MTRHPLSTTAPRWLVLATAGLSALAGAIRADTAPVPAASSVRPDHAAQMARGLRIFKDSVRAVLVDQCLACHGGAKTKGEFDLTSREELLKGGSHGLAVVAGDPARSRLVRLLTHAERPYMPHKAAKLPDPTIRQVAAWIDAGAPYDRPLVEKPAANAGRVVTEKDRQFWSFRPLAPVRPPAAGDGWCRTPVDAFVFDRLNRQGLRPNRAADRRVLIRRAYFDLVGLPPAPEEVDAFVRDPAPDAYEQLLDRLLASPHYGERWARHWLDLARFAESHGYEQDYDRPGAYFYRDFIIRALNDDMPYDRFVRLQIAGDELEPDNPQALMATGFLAAGTHATQITANQAEKERYDELDDMAATIGTSMLGLTVGCARCHDHKFDPIPTRDYYRLVATFTTTVRSEVEMDLEPERYRAAKAEFDRQHAPLVGALEKWEREELPGRLARWLKTVTGKPEKGRPPDVTTALDTPAERRTEAQRKAILGWYRTTDAEWQKLHQAVEEHAKQEPHRPKALIASEGLPAVRLHTQGPDFYDKTYFLKRGDLSQKQGEAAPGFLQVLMRAPEGDRLWAATRPAGWRTSYRRRGLAAWITDVDQGAGHLLARVIVNRLWQHHFGRGIVATPSDFGAQGERPTHPDLLDWLAAELIHQGWRLKPIQKLIMQSAAYREMSDADPACTAVDPDNKLFWRHPRRRLEAEAIRDAMLAVSGRLDGTMYGPGSLDEGQRRRSIYFTIKRSHLIPLMTLFDAPDSLQGLGARASTTIPPQAMALMNNPEVRACARAFARRLLISSLPPGGGGPGWGGDDVIRQGYRVALGREPTAEEAADAAAFISSQAKSYEAGGPADARKRAVVDFCQVLLGLNGFVYLE